MSHLSEGWLSWYETDVNALEKLLLRAQIYVTHAVASEVFRRPPRLSRRVLGQFVLFSIQWAAKRRRVEEMAQAVYLFDAYYATHVDHLWWQQRCFGMQLSAECLALQKYAAKAPEHVKKYVNTSLAAIKRALVAVGRKMSPDL